MRKKIAVLFGGCSPEHGVSLQSAHSVLTAIDKTRYEVIPLGITKDGEWFRYYGDYQKIEDGTWCDNAANLAPVAISQNRKNPGLIEFTGNESVKGYVSISLDAAFPVLHGRNGEDGTVQGLFELGGIPVVGCGVLASALAMDKDRAHRLAHAAGVAIPRSRIVAGKDDMELAASLAEEIGYPLFVKPVRAGSSFGITKVKNRDALPAAIKRALSYDDAAIIEECISGVEIGCAVLGNDKLIVGASDEIELSGDFFDYVEKYTLKTSAIHVPARISADMAEQAKETAKTIYHALGCQGFARVDLFLTDDGRLIFNEVNTIPGFTPHSRFPNMLKEIGMPFEQVVSTAIELAVRE